MALFKIRWPGQQAAEGKPAKVARAVRGETVEVMRRRARHRLIGAALLVLLGVVGFPLIFDTQPRPIPVDTRIEIPDRDKVAPLVVPAVVAPPAASTEAAPVVAARASEPVAKVAKPAPEHAVVPAPVHKDASKPAFTEAKPQAVANKSETRSAAKSESRSEARTEPPAVVVRSPAPPVASVNEADRARALLEGRSGKVAAATLAATPTAAAAAGGDRFIVQVGAFSDEAKAREARQKLERAGIATYTQAVQTKDGMRTRVRVGPFQGREQAEKASAKIKALGLPAAILTL